MILSGKMRITLSTVFCIALIFLLLNHLLIKRETCKGLLVFSNQEADIRIATIGSASLNFSTLKKGIFSEFRATHFPALSLNGKYLAFIGENFIEKDKIEGSYMLNTLIIIKNKNGLFNEYDVIYKSESTRKTMGMLAWSPDGKKLVFFTSDHYSGGFPAGTFKSIINVFDSNTHVTKEIITLSNVEEVIPSWSRDGKYIYFSIWDPEVGYPQVERCNIENKRLDLLTKGNAPSCSPNQDIMLFSDHRNIYISDLEGKNNQILIKNYRAYSTFTDICWAPDGQSFLYYRNNLSQIPPIALFQTAIGTDYAMVVTSLHKPSRRWIVYKSYKLLNGISWAKN